MFIKFFDNLRKSGSPVSLREYLTFLEALSKNIGTYEIENFYILARTIMVKDERHLDRFDIAFSHSFNGLDELSLEEIINKALSENSKLLIWTNFVKNVDYLQGHFKSKGALGIHGGIDTSDRNEMISHYLKSDEGIETLKFLQKIK